MTETGAEKKYAAQPSSCAKRGALKWSDGRVRFESTTNYNLVDDIVIDHDTCMACKLYLDRANVDRG